MNQAIEVNNLDDELEGKEEEKKHKQANNNQANKQRKSSAWRVQKAASSALAMACAVCHNKTSQPVNRRSQQ